ncbi:MAG: hypothetical protein FWG46_05655 [Treponema sp.]|nr:hypothetical protein [Treponema sp.]
MGKKPAFLAVALIAAFIAHACSWPTSIEIKTDKFKLSVPVRIGEFDVAAMLADLLEDSLKDFDGELEIYDMVDYTDAQAFLVAVNMNLMELMDPGDYLDKMNEQMAKMDDIQPGSFTSMKSDPIEMPTIAPPSINETVSIEMKDLFDDIEDTLNNFPAEVISIPVTYLLVKPDDTIDVPTLPGFMSFESNGPKVGSCDFSTVVVKEGKIALLFSLTPVDADLSDVEITIDGISLETEEGPIGIPPVSSKITLNSSNRSDKYEVSLNQGDELDKNDMPQFKIGAITFEYNGSEYDYSFNFSIQPKISGFSMQGIKGLNLTEDFVLNGGALLNKIESALDLGTVPEEFLNADIGEGKLSINIGLPQKPLIPPYGTYCEGLTITYEIFIIQDPIDTDFKGLSDGNGEPWKISGSNNEGTDINLGGVGGKQINGNTVRIIKNPAENHSQIRISTINGGADFEILNDEKNLPVTLEMALTISELKTVRWELNEKIGDLFKENEFTINFEELGGDKNITEFIEFIKFSDIAVGLDFNVLAEHASEALPLLPGECGLPEALQNRLAMGITCIPLEFDGTSYPVSTKDPLLPDPNVFLISSKDVTLDPIPKTITVKTQFSPVINGPAYGTKKYMEIGPVSGGDTLKLFAKPKIDFTWEKARIDLKKALSTAGINPDELSGTFPEREKKGVDLDDNAGKYMSDISLSSKIQAKLFFTGPKQLIDALQPKLNFGAEWEDKDDENNIISDLFYDDTIRMTDLSAKSELLPGKNEKGQYIYEGTEMPGEPDEGMVLNSDLLVDAISAFPRNLRFTYELDMDVITVTPGMFEFDADDEDNLSILFVMMVPLELAVKKGGKFIVPQDVFGDEGKDLFGRNSLDEDSVFTNVNVKSLSLRIDFHEALFRGAVLHIDADRFEEPDLDDPYYIPPKILFREGLSLDSGKSIQVVMKSRDWDIIRSKLIIPNIEIEFREDSTIKIPREFMPTTITITASGSYTAHLEDDLGVKW